LSLNSLFNEPYLSLQWQAEKRLNEEFEAMMNVEHEHEMAAKAAAMLSPAPGVDLTNFPIN